MFRIRPSVGVEERLADQSHETGQAYYADVTSSQDLDDRSIVDCRDSDSPAG